MHALFKAKLHQLGFHVAEIAGTREQRLNDALGAIDALA